VIQFIYMGRVGYSDALALQLRLAELRGEGSIPNTLLLLEHPPVLTLGRNAGRENILTSDEMLAARGVEVHQIKRGGDVTYHGPGQLVGYPIFDLRTLASSHGRMGPVDFVRLMEEALIKVTMQNGIYAGRIAGLTGVWCGLSENENHSATGAVFQVPETSSNEAVKAHICNNMRQNSQSAGSQPGRKIAAIGIHVSRGIVTHGFAYNLTTQLDDFKLINPCGITDRPVTSLEFEMKRAQIDEPVPMLERLAEGAARYFGKVLGEEMVRLASREELDAQMREAEVCR
jgi:lipoyl(octanoyl) transferase